MESGAYKSKGDYQTPVYEVSDHIEPISSASNIRKYEANMLLSDFQNNFNNVVRLSHYYVDKVGILKSAIKFYSTFTQGKILLEGGEEENEEILNDFIKNTKLNKVVRQSIPDLYKAGNIFWYREREGGKTVWVHQLNPIDVEVVGHQRGRPVSFFNSDNDPLTLPRDLEVDSLGRYVLPPERTYHCSLDREGYLRYGKPQTIATFEPIQHIQSLLDMEKHSINEVIESLIIFTLGDENRPATPKQVKELRRRIETLGTSGRLVGNHTLEANMIEKDTSVFSPDKFNVPIKMLMYSIGITPSIFTGEGSYASSTAGMASAKQIIQSNRTELIETLEELFEDIAIENGLNPNDNPKVSLGKLELSEEKVQHQIIRNLFLDGVISADTYAQAHGHLLEIEQEKITEENEMFEIEPRAMSSTLSSSGESEGRPSDKDSHNDSNPSGDNKQSTQT